MPLTPTQLSELGYHLVPWKNRTADERKPIVSGFLENKPSPTTVAEWEARYTECDWAIVPMDHAVVDIEMKNGLNGEQDLLNLFPNVDWSIYPQTKTYSGGRHIWVRLPEGWTKKGGVHIAPGIEIKCRTGSAHIPPSDGYTWITELTSYDTPLGPDELWDAWHNARPASLAKYDATEIIACGARHGFLCSIAGTLRNTGLGEDELVSTLRLIANKRCEKPEEISDEEIAGIAKSYAQKDADSFELRLAHGESAAVSVEAFFSKPVAPRDDIDDVSDGNLHLSDADIRPTALIASWVDWVLDGANRKQPELSLLAACVGIATCIGRKLTWAGSHANIYALGLASSGSGKNDPHCSISRVLEAAGFSDLVGASDVGSDAGLLQQISGKPEIVWPIDEFSMVLEYMNKPNAPGYITNLMKYMTQLYSCNPYNGKALKGVDPVIVANPYPNMMTWAQPKTFLSVFNDKMADSGFIGRFVIFVGEDLPLLNPRAMKKPIPRELIEGLKMARSATSQLFKSVGETRDTVEIKSTEEVREHYYKKVAENEVLVQKHKGTMQGTLWARTAEKANRFSLVHAWSLNPADPEMTIESIDWGFRVMTYANNTLIKLLDARVVNIQDEHAKFVYDIIFKAGSTGLMPSKLISLTHRIDRNRRDSIIQDLIEAGKIVTAKTKAESGKGRPALRYIATANVEK